MEVDLFRLEIGHTWDKRVRDVCQGGLVIYTRDWSYPGYKAEGRLSTKGVDLVNLGAGHT